MSVVVYFITARSKEITKFRNSASEQLKYWIRNPLVSDISDLRKLVRDEEYPQALNLCLALNAHMKMTQNHYPYFKETAKRREFDTLQSLITTISDDLLLLDAGTEVPHSSTTGVSNTKNEQLTRLSENIEGLRSGFQALVTELYNDIHQTDLIYTGYFPANPIPLSRVIPQSSNGDFSLRQIMLTLFCLGLVTYPILNQIFFKGLALANALLFLIGILALWSAYKKITKT